MSRAREAGQASVELALTLPLVAVVLLAVVQAGLVLRDHLLVGHAAREAARAAAVDPDRDVARHAAVESSPLRVDRLEVSLDGGGERGDRAAGDGHLPSPRRSFPWSGRLIDDVGLEAEAATRRAQ
ncbi:MAG: TadE/TadG family type IV pilus assembly protein [Acidimicrobiia bacterium]|nr:TadE/TadG family type IV pilus assembly protein [Acidimicrobiia bacterium]